MIVLANRKSLFGDIFGGKAACEIELIWRENSKGTWGYLF